MAAGCCAPAGISLSLSPSFSLFIIPYPIRSYMLRRRYYVCSIFFSRVPYRKSLNERISFICAEFFMLVTYLTGNIVDSCRVALVNLVIYVNLLDGIRDRNTRLGSYLYVYIHIRITHMT